MLELVERNWKPNQRKYLINWQIKAKIIPFLGINTLTTKFLNIIYGQKPQKKQKHIFFA